MYPTKAINAGAVKRIAQNEKGTVAKVINAPIGFAINTVPATQSAPPTKASNANKILQDLKNLARIRIPNKPNSIINIALTAAIIAPK